MILDLRPSFSQLVAARELPETRQSIRLDEHPFKPRFLTAKWQYEFDPGRRFVSVSNQVLIACDRYVLTHCGILICLVKEHGPRVSYIFKTGCINDYNFVMYETAFVSVPAIHLDMEVRAGFRLEFVVVDHPKLFDAMGKSTLWEGR